MVYVLFWGKFKSSALYNPSLRVFVSAIHGTKNKLNDKGCFGSPDMIVKIVSKFNPGNDYVKKLYLYEKYKVKE